MHKARKIILMLFDFVVVPFACMTALVLNSISGLSIVQSSLIFELLISSVLTVLLFSLFGLYRSLWEFASIDELVRIVAACAVSSLINVVLFKLFDNPLVVAVYIIWFLVLTVMIGGSRMSFRVFRRFKYGMAWGVNPLEVFVKYNAPKTPRKRVMIVGAGQAGSSAIQEINHDRFAEVVCAVDDADVKKNMLINGVRVMGGRRDIPLLADRYRVDEIVVAIPAAKSRELAEILEICKSTGAKLRLVPSTSELLKGRVTVQHIRDVEIEDLLGRDVVALDTNTAGIKGKTVLVTGGAGSIGSELCRQLTRLEPKRVVVYELNENEMHMLSQEIDIIPVVGSVRDPIRLKAVFDEYKPDIVFHAAAHKHVPLMEACPGEAVKNNVFGTYYTATAAINAGVKKFVLISTDKAVNPTNIMGATKRMAEMVIRALDKKQSDTLLCAVRFGNVLGSNGSVVPIFKRQIRNGGPVTVMHPEITRFFMTISEAAGLVIQAGQLAAGGEIFILDMGEPIKIADLARDMIRLSGLEPNVDIPIVYTGLRPGEKLYEELLMDEEGLSSTTNNKIFIGKPFEADFGMLKEQLETLEEAVKGSDSEKVVRLLREYVPTYRQEDEG